jgi:hypothetical protein
MKPFWVTVVAQPAVGLLAREVHAEMTALFAVTAAPAPGTDLVPMNTQDAAHAGRNGNPHADRDPSARLPLPQPRMRAQVDGNARILRSTAWYRRLTVQLNT